MSLSFSLNLVFIIVAIYVYQIRFNLIDCKKIDLDDIHFKTGDLILFKAQNNPNDVLTCSYFTHVGICIGDAMFEANGIEGMHLKDWHPKNGIFVSNTRNRVSKYKGKCYYRPFNGVISSAQEKNLYDFIIFAKANFYYDKRVIKSAFNNKFNYGTNCGEIVYLAMVALGILPNTAIDKKPFHCVRYVCNYGEDNLYSNTFEIMCHPF